LNCECVLLTGATGLIGSATLDVLLRETDVDVVALCRRPDILPSHPKLIPVRSDISAPDLTLPPDTSRSLQERVDQIIHCAADTRFSLSLAQARTVNTAGTRHMIQWAMKCRKLARFIHVSTAFVGGRLEGHLPEAPVSHTAGYTNTYQQSKHEAEAEVFAAMDELPAMVVRPSSVIGNSNGFVSQFNYFHQLLRLVPRNPLPVIPGDPAAQVDLIPCDWAAPVLSKLTDGAFRQGQVLHLCAGPERSMRAGDLVRHTFELFASHPRSGAARMKPPDLVPPREFERFVAKLDSRNQGLISELIRVIRQFLPQMAVRQTFDTTNARAIASAPPHPATYFDKVVRYCIDTNWGRTREIRPGQ
jgi:nucleoside-diphosphate-sugar epimerase